MNLGRGPIGPAVKQDAELVYRRRGRAVLRGGPMGRGQPIATGKGAVVWVHAEGTVEGGGVRLAWLMTRSWCAGEAGVGVGESQHGSGADGAKGNARGEKMGIGHRMTLWDTPPCVLVAWLQAVLHVSASAASLVPCTAAPHRHLLPQAPPGRPAHALHSPWGWASRHPGGRRTHFLAAAPGCASLPTAAAAAAAGHAAGVAAVRAAGRGAAVRAAGHHRHLRGRRHQPVPGGAVPQPAPLPVCALQGPRYGAGAPRPALIRWCCPGYAASLPLE